MNLRILVDLPNQNINRFKDILACLVATRDIVELRQSKASHSQHYWTHLFPLNLWLELKEVL